MTFLYLLPHYRDNDYSLQVSYLIIAYKFLILPHYIIQISYLSPRPTYSNQFLAAQTMQIFLPLVFLLSFSSFYETLFCFPQHELDKKKKNTLTSLHQNKFINIKISFKLLLYEAKQKRGFSTLKRKIVRVCVCVCEERGNKKKSRHNINILQFKHLDLMFCNSALHFKAICGGSVLHMAKVIHRKA